MSLVNDMLRDLDKRERQSQQAQRINNAFRGNTAPTARGSSLRFSLLAVLSVLVGLGSGYLLFNRASEPVVSVPPQSAPELALATPRADSSEDNEVASVIPATLSLRQEAISPHSFALRLSADQRLLYRVGERSTRGLSLVLEGVGSVARHDIDIPGLSLVQSDGQVEISYSGIDDTVFQVQEDSETPEFDILLMASWRPAPLQTPLAAATPQLLPPPMHDTANELAASTLPSSAFANGMSASGAGASTEQNAARQLPPAPVPAPMVRTDVSQIRTTRELTLDQRDAMASQQAAAMVQSGRLFEAYQALLDFVAANPDAHLSRETLATVLVAQHEFVQAGIIVDEGLRLVPNYAPFKKIKARLLMQESRNADALQLMVSLPPAVSDDLEYHELLATLYQQNGNYDQAVAAYQELLRRDSSQGRWWAGMGISLEAQGKTPEALASYQAALQTVNLDPNLRQYAQSKAKLLSTPE